MACLEAPDPRGKRCIESQRIGRWGAVGRQIAEPDERLAQDGRLSVGVAHLDRMSRRAQQGRGIARRQRPVLGQRDS